MNKDTWMGKIVHKYICVSDEDKPTFFTFPRMPDHDRMFEAIQITGDHGFYEILSAGFVSASGNLTGHSETLGVKSRPIDTKLYKEDMNRKYIVIMFENEEMIFTFPNMVMHSHMWEAIEAIRHGSDRNWERKFRKATLVSAGFVFDNEFCGGRSESLGISSRGVVDSNLLVGR